MLLRTPLHPHSESHSLRLQVPCPRVVEPPPRLMALGLMVCQAPALGDLAVGKVVSFPDVALYCPILLVGTSQLFYDMWDICPNKGVLYIWMHDYAWFAILLIHFSFELYNEYVRVTLKEYMWSRWKGPVMFSYISWNDGIGNCLSDSLVYLVIPKAKLSDVSILFVIKLLKQLLVSTWCSRVKFHMMFPGISGAITKLTRFFNIFILFGPFLELYKVSWRC